MLVTFALFVLEVRLPVAVCVNILKIVSMYKADSCALPIINFPCFLSFTFGGHITKAYAFHQMLTRVAFQDC